MLIIPGTLYFPYVQFNTTWPLYETFKRDLKIGHKDFPLKSYSSSPCGGWGRLSNAWPTLPCPLFMLKFVLANSWLVPHMTFVLKFPFESFIYLGSTSCANPFVVGNRGTKMCPFLQGFCTFLLALVGVVFTHLRHTRCWCIKNVLWLVQNPRLEEMDRETSLLKVSNRMRTVQEQQSTGMVALGHLILSAHPGF